MLTLDRDCLRLGEEGPAIIWPPGFVPHTAAGVVEVRNGSGHIMARVGDPIEVGGGVTDGGDGPCGSGVWVDTRILG